MYESYTKTRIIAGPFEICRWNEHEPEEPAVWILPGGEKVGYNTIKKLCESNGWPGPVKKTVKVRYKQEQKELEQ